MYRLFDMPAAHPAEKSGAVEIAEARQAAAAAVSAGSGPVAPSAEQSSPRLLCQTVCWLQAPEARCRPPAVPL